MEASTAFFEGVRQTMEADGFDVRGAVVNPEAVVVPAMKSGGTVFVTASGRELQQNESKEQLQSLVATRCASAKRAFLVGNGEPTCP